MRLRLGDDAHAAWQALRYLGKAYEKPLSTTVIIGNRGACGRVRRREGHSGPRSFHAQDNKTSDTRTR